MPAVWLISDTHFGHEKTCSVFRREDGTPLRPFSNAGEMDEAMVQRWNERVRPSDKVYHLGDVALRRQHLDTLSRLNGDKVLIKGNHDIFKLEEYTKYFRDVRSYHVLNGMILSHIPVHCNNLGRFGTNIHGHLHAIRVKKATGVDSETGCVVYGNEIDTRYYSVCVEYTDYAPVLLEDVIANIVNEGGSVGLKDN